MNEAETRAELIDSTPKAAGRDVVRAERVGREVITLGRPRCIARSPSTRRGNIPLSSHIHGYAIIGHPTWHVPHRIKDVGDHRWRPRIPGEPITMQLDPAKSISRKVWIGSGMSQPGTRTGRDPLHRGIVSFNQPPGGVGTRGPMRHGPKIASDHAQIL